VTTVKQYAQQLRSVAVAVSARMGENVAFEDRSERIRLNLILGMVCVLIKLLVDQGVLTDAQIQAAFTVFLGDPSGYPDVPDPPDPWK
jgi:hypothetical protein